MSFLRGKKPRPAPTINITGTPLAGYALFPQPADAPAFNQSGMSSYSPAVLDLSPHASAPIISRITNDAGSGECISCAGHQFDDLMTLYIYSELNGAGNLLAASLLSGSRIGNTSDWKIHASSLNSFMLAWMLHPTYGYSEPIAINSPDPMTLHGKFYGRYTIADHNAATAYTDIVTFAGDQFRVGGANMVGAAGKCWAYLVPTGGGSGTWVVSDSADWGGAIFTTPAISNGTYTVWIHTGEGGRWGWGKVRKFVLRKQAAPSVSEYAMPAPSGGDDTSAYNTVKAGIPVGVDGYIKFQAGTYNLGSISLLTGGTGRAHFRGAGQALTTINGGNYTVSSGYCWMEDLTHNGGLGQAFSRLLRVTVNGNAQCAGALSAEDCTFLGGGLNSGSASTVIDSPPPHGPWIRSTTISQKDNTEGCFFYGFSMRNIAFDDVIGIQDNIGSQTNAGARLYIVGAGSHASSFRNCSTVSLKVIGNQNRGEIIHSGDGGFVANDYKASGGTSTTITISPSAMVTGFSLLDTTTGSSSNATNSTPTLTFPYASVDTRAIAVQITGGTNAIPGIYPITARSGSNASSTVTLSGGPIGSSASLSNVQASLIHRPYYASYGDISSSNANASTPTISSATSFSSPTQLNNFAYFPNLNIVVKITAVSGTTATLSAPISGSASISGEPCYIFRNYAATYSDNPYIAFVKGGKGVSQVAMVTGFSTDGTSIILALDRSFRVTTDSTSYVQLGYGNIDTVIYNTNLQGNGDQADEPWGGAGTGSSCFFSSFGPNANTYIHGGSITGVRYGIVDEGIATSPTCNLWFSARNFSITNVSTAVRRLGVSNSTPPNAGQEVTGYGGVLNNITITNAFHSQGHFDQGRLSRTVWNNVQASGNAPLGLFSFFNGDNGHIFMNNCTISLGTGTFAGSDAWNSVITVHQSNPSSGQFVGFQS